MHRNLRYFFAVLLAAAAIDSAASAQSTPTKALATLTKAPVVRIESGRVRGLAADGVVSFKGIPYAAPPIGKLRWRPPQMAKHWDGVRDATKFGPECMQTTDEVPKSEACLTLKVIDFTNNGVVVGPDPLKAKLDLWRKVWSQDQ